MEKKFKSKYAGVYFVIVLGPGGRGNEKKFYIKYRRGGRGSKEIHELLGSESQGWTEKRASDERLRRKTGNALSNTEKREALLEEQKTREMVLTYSEVWNAYHEHGKGKRSKRSLQTDVSLNKQHISPFLDKKSVAEMKTDDIAAMRKKAEEKNLSPQMVKHVLALVRRVLRWGVKHGLCRMPENLIFDMPQVDNQKTETMTSTQLAAYLKALDEEPDQETAAILRLALATGMRKSAILALRWEDIDLERGYITLRGENAKSGKTAVLPLNNAAISILNQLEQRSEYLFPGRYSGHREGISRMARRVRDKAGLKDFRPMHGLRHVFASTLASNGVDLYTLQALLTHGSPAMTQRYAHLSNEHLRDAANVANRLAEKDEKD